jgi:hypothetical protein
MAPVRRKGSGGGGGEGAVKKGGGGGKSFWGKNGFEGEVYNNLIDVVCTWGMLSGMAASVLWVNWSVPQFCAGASPDDKVLNPLCCCCPAWLVPLLL